MDIVIVKNNKDLLDVDVELLTTKGIKIVISGVIYDDVFTQQDNEVDFPLHSLLSD